MARSAESSVWREGCDREDCEGIGGSNMNNAELSRGGTSQKKNIEIYFEEFCGDALGIFFYGSHTQGHWSERSDIDIYIVKPGNDYVQRIINKKLGVKYDAKVFEKMPLYIWIEIIHNHQIIYGDAVEIGAYFYRFGRLCVDMEPWIRDNRFSSVGEQMAL